MHFYLILAAVLPAIWLIRHYVKSDAYPEPTGLILKTAGVGIVIVIPIIILELLLMTQLDSFTGTVGRAFFQAFVVAGFIEELFKYLALKKYCARKSEFDEPMDAIVYAVVISLGFALLENVMYVLQSAEEDLASGFMIAAFRACTAVPAHASFGVIMGYHFANQHFSKVNNLIPKALLLPILWHGFYDFLLFLQHPVALLVFIPFLIYMIRKARKLHQIRKNEQMSQQQLSLS